MVILMCDEKENQDQKTKKKKASLLVQTLPDISVMPPMKEKKKK